MWPFVTGFFYMKYFLSLSRSHYISVSCFSYFWVVHTFYLHTHQLMDFGLFLLCLLWRMPLWTIHLCKFLCEIYLGVVLLGYMGILCILRNDPLFSKAASPFYIPISNSCGLQYLCNFTNICHVFHFSHPSRWKMVSHCSFDPWLLYLHLSAQ